MLVVLYMLRFPMIAKRKTTRALGVDGSLIGFHGFDNFVMMPCQQFICQAFALHLVQVHQEDQCSACWWSRDRASDSLWSLVERCQWDGGAAGPGQNYCLPSTHSQFPLFSGTITTYGYCLLKGDCAFDFAKS